MLAKSGDIQQEYEAVILPDKLARSLNYARISSLWTDIQLILFSIGSSLRPGHRGPQGLRKRLSDKEAP